MNRDTIMRNKLLVVIVGITLLQAIGIARAQPPANAPPVHEVMPGPHAVVIESLASLPTHTVYRPVDLDRFNEQTPLPIVSWGNGGCARNGMAFSGFLSQIVSHGYVAIAIGPKDVAPRAPGERALAAPDTTQPAELDDQLLLDAIDWALAQNDDPASPLYHKLDVDRIAVMGQSCGGLQTMAVAHDPRITTTVLWNSGVLPTGAPTPGGRMLSAATKQSLDTLHAPIAYFIGGESDIAYPNAEDDFARITRVPVFKANLNVGHGGTYRDAGGGWFGEVAVQWLDWRLKDKDSGAAWFVGENCRLCADPLWQVEKKGME